MRTRKQQASHEQGVTWTGQILCSIWWWLQGFANLSRFKLFINLWSRRCGASRRWRQILNSRHLKVQKVSNGKDHRAILTTYIVITRKMISENNRLSLRLHTCIYTMFTHERIGTQDCRILHNQHKLTYILSLQQHGQSQNYLSFSKMDRRKEKESTSLFLHFTVSFKPSQSGHGTGNHLYNHQRSCYWIHTRTPFFLVGKLSFNSLRTSRDD